MGLTNILSLTKDSINQLYWLSKVKNLTLVFVCRTYNLYLLANPSRKFALLMLPWGLHYEESWLIHHYGNGGRLKTGER